MFGISVLAMLVIGAYFAVALTPIAYASENENENITGTSTSTNLSTLTPTIIPSPTVTPTPSTTPTISISKKIVTPNESFIIEVHAPDAENVSAKINNRTTNLSPKDNKTWSGKIEAPVESGKYNLSVFVNGKNIGQESLEVAPLWLIFLKNYWLLLVAAAVAIIGLSLLIILRSTGDMEQRKEKLRVMVRKEDNRALEAAMVTVGSLKKKTGETGMTDDFKLPVGVYEIKVEKEGYKPSTHTREIRRGENKEEDVDLRPVEHVGKSLEVEVVDEEGTKIKEAKVGISRGNKILGEIDVTDESGIDNLEMPESKGKIYVFAEKEGYEEVKKLIDMEQPSTFLRLTAKRKRGILKLTVLSEENEPLNGAVVTIAGKEKYTTSGGKIEIDVPWDVHKLRIDKEEYKLYEETVNVKGDIPLEIKLKAKSGALEVKVVDKESGESIESIEVRVRGTPKITNKEGFVGFDKVLVGRQTIEVSDPTGVYSLSYQTAEIKEKITTPIKMKLSSSFEIPESKREDLRAAYKYLEDQRERVATYDCYLPDYYMKIGEKLVGIVSDSGKSRKLLRDVRGIRDITPTVFVEDLADVISNGCMEIGKGMRERRNLEIFEDIKRFVVDKGLAKSKVEVFLKDVESEDIKKYIERGREGTEGLLREVDQSLTRTVGNIYPMSVLFKVARQIMNSDTSSDDKAKALVASVILEYVRVMLKDDKVEKRLRGLIT